MNGRAAWGLLSSQPLPAQKSTAVSSATGAATRTPTVSPQAPSRSVQQRQTLGLCHSLIGWGPPSDQAGEEVLLLSRALACSWVPAAALISIWDRSPAAAVRVTAGMASGPVSSWTLAPRSDPSPTSFHRGGGLRQEPALFAPVRVLRGSEGCATLPQAGI